MGRNRAYEYFVVDQRTDGNVWPWNDSLAAVAGVTKNVIEKGGEMLFQRQPIAPNVLNEHLTSNLKREITSTIRWENKVDGRASYSGLSENYYKFNIAPTAH